MKIIFDLTPPPYGVKVPSLVTFLEGNITNYHELFKKGARFWRMVCNVHVRGTSTNTPLDIAPNLIKNLY